MPDQTPQQVNIFTPEERNAPRSQNPASLSSYAGVCPYCGGGPLGGA